MSRGNQSATLGILAKNLDWTTADFCKCGSSEDLLEDCGETGRRRVWGLPLSILLILGVWSPARCPWERPLLVLPPAG